MLRFLNFGILKLGQMTCVKSRGERKFSQLGNVKIQEPIFKISFNSRDIEHVKMSDSVLRAGIFTQNGC